MTPRLLLPLAALAFGLSITPAFALFDAQQAVAQAGANYGSAPPTPALPSVPKEDLKLKERQVVICKPEKVGYGKEQQVVCESKPR